jgi:putative transposase
MPTATQDEKGSLKIELVNHTNWRTRDEAENPTFAYIDGRVQHPLYQEELGYLSPDEYEAAWHTRQNNPAESPITTPAVTGGR